MRLLGVVLAGGKATRLPNKLLLPIRRLGECAPMLTASIDYLLGHNINDIVIAHKSNESPADILHYLYPYAPWTCVPDNYAGIPDALTNIANRFTDTHDTLVVVCGDNVYPSGERILHWVSNTVIVRNVYSRGLSELDRWHEGRVVTRHACSSDVTQALTTPWVLSIQDILSIAGVCKLPFTMNVNVITWLNTLHVDAWFMSSTDWRDLGTEQSYKEYWDESRI